MIFSTIRSAFRSLKRSNLLGTLNIAGLTVALTATFFITSFVHSEYSIDSQLEERDHLFRIIRSVEGPKSSYRTPTLSAVFGDKLSTDLGLDEGSITRVYKDNELVTYNELSILEDNFLYVDKNFLMLFQYPFDYGNAKTALADKNSVVISHEKSVQYFGDENPIGKIIDIDGKGPLVVSGVLSNDIEKSHLQIEFLAPIEAMGYSKRILQAENVHSTNFYLYLSNKENSAYYQQNLQRLSQSYFQEEAMTSAISTKLSLQPLSEVYFDKDTTFDIAQHGDKSLVKSLSLITILILLIAGANFINFTMASCLRKVKTFGVRKALGSSKRALLTLLLTETYLSVIISMVLAALLYTMIQNHLPYDIVDASKPIITSASIFYFVIGSVLLTLAMGLYPAWTASSISSKNALTRKTSVIKHRKLQNGLLTFQFVGALVLIIVTMVISGQFNYMKTKELGVDKEQVLIFSSNNKHSWRNKEQIGNEVAQLNTVQQVAMVYGGIPGSTSESYEYLAEGSEVSFQFKTAFTDINFLETLDLKLISGRGFEKDISTDLTEAVVINEAAAKRLGWPEVNVIGIELTNPAEEQIGKRKIIGVIKDYHFESMRNLIDPLILCPTGWEESFLVKLSTTNYNQSIADIESIWNTYVPKYPFSYRFLDDSFQKLHEADTKQRETLYFFSLISILIACFGVFGLSALALQMRTKEIAIRKVLGASMLNNLKVLSSSFIKLLLVANLVALPLSWFLSKEWLMNFSYRTDLKPVYFITGSAIVIIVIMAIVFSQAFRVSKTNPSVSLRLE